MTDMSQDFGTVYDAHAEEIYDFLYYKTFDKTLTEDLTSITFTKALAHYSAFKKEEGASVRSWLYRIAKHTVIDHYRTKKETIDFDEGPELSDPSSLSREIENKITLEEVTEKLKILPEHHQEIIILRLWQELSFKEISLILGKTEDSAKMAYHRAISAFRLTLPL
jgi:RNA polymerase sigma-70 factor (ECF subfamily)